MKNICTYPECPRDLWRQSQNVKVLGMISLKPHICYHMAPRVHLHNADTKYL